jgi:hypothetical protein
LAALLNKLVEEVLSFKYCQLLLCSCDFFRRNRRDEEAWKSPNEYLSELEEEIVLPLALNRPVGIFASDWVGMILA